MKALEKNATSEVRASGSHWCPLTAIRFSLEGCLSFSFFNFCGWTSTVGIPRKATSVDPLGRQSKPVTSEF